MAVVTRKLWSLLAWRNIWRQRRRTIITLFAISFGVGTIISYDSLLIGMMKRMLQNATSNQTGLGQIHVKTYLQTKDPLLTIKNYSQMEKELAPSIAPRSLSPRLKGEGVISIGDRTRMVELIGIIPAKEKMVTDWYRRIRHGHFLNSKGQILIGHKLAQRLEVEVGSKVVLSSAQPESGEISHQLFKVAGIIHSNSTAIDSSSAFIHLNEAQKLMGLPGEVHEVAISLGKLSFELDKSAVRKIETNISDELYFSNWKSLLPAFAQMIDLLIIYLVFVFAILFFMVGLGVTNTLSMSLYERFREFGIMLSLGTKRRELFYLVFLESFFMGAIGALFGILLGNLFNYYLGTVGISMGNAEVMGMSFSDAIHPEIHWIRSIIIGVIFWFLTPVLALWPIYKLGKLDPITAIRMEE